MLKQKKKVIYIILLIVYLINSFSGIVSATQINNAQVINLGSCGYHLQFWDAKQNAWSYIITTLTGYNYQGKTHYAYCLDKNLNGVGEADSYTVDISKLLDDVRIWRTITSGFPYKTANQLGCETDEDAFVATKQAVYCILYDYNPNTRYKGGDTRGEKIKQAIINMVNEGRNGTRTPQSANVTVNKIGNIVKVGEYCYQEMSVNSFVNMGSYTVTGTSVLPDGAKIVDINGNEKTTFNGNEHFKIKIPTKNIKENMEILVRVLAKCENYPIFYGKAPSSDLQDYALTFDPMSDESGIAKLNIDTHKSTIKIIKQDAETKTRLSGVVFNFKYSNGENIGNYTTDKNGEITINKLKPGKIIVTELETNKNYILNTKENQIDLSYEDKQIITIENERKRGDLQVYKVDKDNNKIALGNVAFELYSNELKKVIGTYRTDVNGKINIKNLRVGDYSLIEKETNKWYNLAKDTNIKVEWNTTSNVIVENELKKGQIKINKIDKENNEIKLEGVKFGVYDDKNNLLETLVTNKDGEAYSQKYAIRDYEKIKLVELETKDEYILDNEPKTITLKENQIMNVTFENEKIKGKIEITKVDAKDENKKLEGAKFGLYDNKNNLIETLTTTKNGTAISKDLYKGKYYLKELETGSNYYLLNDNTFEFEIVKNGEIVKKTIENQPVDITIDVDKVGTTEIKPGEDVNYEFSNVANNSNVYLDNFKWYDYIPTDYIKLQKMTTGTWNQELTYKVYYKTNKSDEYILFKEKLNTDENYELDFTQITLADDEYITETCFDFGKVEKGFKENTKPTMNCKSFDTLKENDTFTNYVKTVGTYFGVTAEANSKWTTITHTPEEKHEIVLPKTGK